MLSGNTIIQSNVNLPRLKYLLIPSVVSFVSDLVSLLPSHITLFEYSVFASYRKPVCAPQYIHKTIINTMIKALTSHCPKKTICTWLIRVFVNWKASLRPSARFSAFSCITFSSIIQVTNRWLVEWLCIWCATWGIIIMHSTNYLFRQNDSEYCRGFGLY